MNNLREVSHWQSWDLNPSSLAPEPNHCFYFLILLALNQVNKLPNKKNTIYKPGIEKLLFC